MSSEDDKNVLIPLSKDSGKKITNLYFDEGSEGELIEINDLYLIRHDKTGKTAYSQEDKEKIINDFLKSASREIYVSTTENATKIKGNLKDSKKFVISEQRANIVRDNIMSAIVYIGYTDGNFKNCDYLLIGQINRAYDVVYLYLHIDNSSYNQYGPLFSSLSKEIQEFGKSHIELDSNLYKMMKRNKYKLVNEAQKSYLFGKGHMAETDNKVTVKKDLDRLFVFMQMSKNAVKENIFDPIEFDIETLRYFKFEKIE